MRKKQPKAFAPRCVLYLRVSTKDQADEGFSLDAQLRMMGEYAAAQGMEVAESIVTFESAKRRGRKDFQRAIETVRREGLKHLVFEKVDRSSRNFYDGAQIETLIREEGLTVHYAKDRKTLHSGSPSTDWLTFGIQLVLAKHFIDNLREEVVKGMKEKAAQGYWPSVAPVGYLNTEKGHLKTIEVDPVRGPIVCRLFEAYAHRGFSIEDCRKLAKELGLRSPKGHAYGTSSIARVLDNPIYAGTVRWDGKESRGHHKPIISEELWNLVQERLHGRVSRAGSGKREIMYRGLITCAYCGCSITAQIKKERFTYYHCTGRRDPQCPGKKAVREESITDQFALLLEEMVLDDEQFVSLKAALRKSLEDETKFRTDALARIDREEKVLRDRLERMYLDRLDGKVAEDLYERLDKRTRGELLELDIQRKAVGVAEASHYDLGVRVLELAQTAPLRFKKANPETKREIMLELLAECQLEGGKVKVRLREPYQTLLMENVRQAQNVPADAGNQDWYSGRDSNPRSSP